MQDITEQEIDRITSATCEALAKEKKVTVRIDPLHGEAFWEGGINGHFFRIRTGEPVSVPVSLAALIAGSNRVRLEGETRVRPYAAGGGARLN